MNRQAILVSCSSYAVFLCHCTALVIIVPILLNVHNSGDDGGLEITAGASAAVVENDANVVAVVAAKV